MKRDFTPEGWPAVIPRIVSHKAEQLVQFIKDVSSAAGDYLTERADCFKHRWFNDHDQ